MSCVHAVHDLLAVTRSPFDPHQQCVRRISPEKSRIEPEVFERCATDRARDPPALHPTPQPRAAGDRICSMPKCARTTDLRGLPDRHQSTAHSSTTPLRHAAHQVRRAAQNFGKPRPVAARQFEVEVTKHRDFDAIVAEKAHPTHAHKHSVPVDP
jgi:hypothetical protein